MVNSSLIQFLSLTITPEGHEISVFDTSFVNVSKYSSNEEHVETQAAGEEVLNFVPTDLTSHNIVEENIDLEKSFLKKLQEFSPDMIALTIFSNEYGLGMTLLQIAKKYGKKDLQYKLRSIAAAGVAYKKADKKKNRRKAIKLFDEALAAHTCPIMEAFVSGNSFAKGFGKGATLRRGGDTGF